MAGIEVDFVEWGEFILKIKMIKIESQLFQLAAG